MQQLKIGFFFILGMILFLGSFYLFLKQPAPTTNNRQLTTNQAILRIGEKTIPVEIADTVEARTLGLSGRKSLEHNSGLLFVFENPSLYNFWMKDMHFAIDIVWIDENWTVVDIDEAVSPETFPTAFTPSTAVNYVLELNSGDASRLGIDIGSKLYLTR